MPKSSTPALLPTIVSPLTPLSCTAAIKFSGMPHSPNPPAAIVMIKGAVEESTRALVSPDGWKLCLRDKDLNELYNLNEDPFETRNLYPDPQHASLVSGFTTEVYRWQQATNDKLKL